MAKWADYLITGVWFSKHNNSEYISDVMLHKDGDTGFQEGEKTPESEVIKLLKAKNTIMTITWNYPKWKKGAYVTYETRAGKEFLITDKNATVKDNLDNSIRMDAFPIIQNVIKN